MGIPLLMYHEIRVPGRQLCLNDPGYARYAVELDAFKQQVGWLLAQSFHGVSISQALSMQAQPGVVGLTVDDGCETDLLVIAPLLRTAGFAATFYVVAGFVGRPGYLSADQVREIVGLGFEVGCHSMTHPFLTDLSEHELQSEIWQAKDKLEQIAGAAVSHFSCPGGRWNWQVAEAAQTAGFQSVATSRIGLLSPNSDRLCLPRIAVLGETTTHDFAKVCRGESLYLRSGRDAVLNLGKKLLGNRIYDLMRKALLGP